MMDDETMEAAPDDEMVEGEAMESEAAPAQDDVMRRLTLAERKILYSQPTSDKIVKILQSQRDPVDALASAGILVLSAMNEAAKGKIPPEYAGPLRQVLLEDLAELADASGIDIPEGVVAAAGQRMTESVRIAQQGGMPPAVQRGGPRPEAPQAAPAQPQGLISQGM